jgi:hypothetical protein
MPESLLIAPNETSSHVHHMTLRYWHSATTTTSRPTSTPRKVRALLEIFPEMKATLSVRSPTSRPCPNWRNRLLSSASHGKKNISPGSYQRTAGRAREEGPDGRHVPIVPVDRRSHLLVHRRREWAVATGWPPEILH